MTSASYIPAPRCGPQLCVRDEIQFTLCLHFAFWIFDRVRLYSLTSLTSIHGGCNSVDSIAVSAWTPMLHIKHHSLLCPLK